MEFMIGSHKRNVKELGMGWMGEEAKCQRQQNQEITASVCISNNVTNQKEARLATSIAVSEHQEVTEASFGSIHCRHT